jgi:hypothetical protein
MATSRVTLSKAEAIAWIYGYSFIENALTIQS